MSLASSTCSRCCSSILRSSRTSASRPAAAAVVSQQRQWTASRRWQSTATESTDPKITAIVDQISQLNLLQTADLVQTLKSRLNIPDLPVGGFAAAGPAAPAAPVEEEEAAPKAEEKTLFKLTLKAFDAAAKPKVIKEVKSMLGLSLVDSKKFVESAPKEMKDGVPKDECEKIIAAMKALGAEVVMD